MVMFFYITKMSVGNNYVVSFLSIVESVYVDFIHSSFKSTMGKNNQKKVRHK